MQALRKWGRGHPRFGDDCRDIAVRSDVKGRVDGRDSFWGGLNATEPGDFIRCPLFYFYSIAVRQTQVDSAGWSSYVERNSVFSRQYCQAVCPYLVGRVSICRYSVRSGYDATNSPLAASACRPAESAKRVAGMPSFWNSHEVSRAP